MLENFLSTPERVHELRTVLENIFNIVLRISASLFCFSSRLPHTKICGKVYKNLQKSTKITPKVILWRSLGGSWGPLGLKSPIWILIYLFLELFGPIWEPFWTYFGSKSN
jgi:hypothetical protein